MYVLTCVIKLFFINNILFKSTVHTYVHTYVSNPSPLYMHVELTVQSSTTYVSMDAPEPQRSPYIRSLQECSLDQELCSAWEIVQIFRKSEMAFRVIAWECVAVEMLNCEIFRMHQWHSEKMTLIVIKTVIGLVDT